jgi:hypothetical protein
MPILDATHDTAHPVEKDEPYWSESYYCAETDAGLLGRIGIRPSINIGDDTHFGGIRMGTETGDVHKGWVWRDGRSSSIRAGSSTRSSRLTG